MLRWSIATVSMGGTLEAKLAAVARAGFRAVEIFENDLTFFSGKPKDVRAQIRSDGRIGHALSRHVFVVFRRQCG
jgi:4-hydroxyphenylpyruvate dioxygenase